MKQEFENFKLKRSVSLFRSTDFKNTSTYFTENKNGEAFFELLRFEFDSENHCEYLRYPNTDHFIELYGGGCNSSHGNMKYTSVENIWDENRHIEIKEHGSNLILFFGKFGSTFNFMKLVGRSILEKDECFYRNEIKQLDCPEIEKALKLKYLKLPESIREIEYFMKPASSSYNVKMWGNSLFGQVYFVVDHPAYNFQYINHRFRVITGGVVEELLIKNFGRYRDGGTTIITVVKDGKEYKFFSPTKLGGQKLKPVWDATEIDVNKGVVTGGVELTEKITKKEKEKIIKLLDIDLKPEEK